MTHLHVKKTTFLLLFFMGVAFSVYGRSLSYEFVFDDVERISRNHAIKTLADPLRFFTDSSTQSNNPKLNQHAFRPLVILGFAIDYALFGDHPLPYRLQNIFWHGLNGFLMALLGVALFEFSLLESLAAGLLFLVHPVQVEAVVWVVERTNVVSLAWILIATLCWVQYLKTERFRFVLGACFSFAVSLLYREIAFCWPAMIGLISISLWPRSLYRRKIWIGFLLFALIDIIYFICRSHFIGQVKIHDYWGGTWATNLATVFRLWPQYIEYAVWPHQQNIHPFQQYSDSIFSSGSLRGYLVFSLFIALASLVWTKNKKMGLCFWLFLLFWIPGSNIIPHPGLFAERLMYPLIIFAAWAFVLLIDRYKMIGGYVFVGIVIAYVWETSQYIPVWQNNVTLWSHSLQLNSKGWMGWAGLGDGQAERGSQFSSLTQNAERQYWFSQAEQSYIKALKQHVPIDSAADIFFSLAIVNLKQGKIELADEHAKRAVILNPKIKNAWDKIRFPQ